MRPSNKLLTFTVLASCFLSMNCSNRQSSTPVQTETNSTHTSNSASSPPSEKATTPESVSRLEARVAEFEKRLAAVEAQLPRIAATTSGAPQVQSGQLSGSTLTREKAKALIQSALPRKDLIPIKKRDSFAKGVEDNVFVGRFSQPSDEAKKYFKAVEFPSIRLTNSIERVVSEIDGITDGREPGKKVVSFKWQFRNVPEYVTKYSGLQTTDTFGGMAELRLYDDGWRVETLR